MCACESVLVGVYVCECVSVGVWACVSVRVWETEQSEILKYFHLFCCLVASELQEKCLHKNRPASFTPISHSPKFQRSCILRSFDNQAKNKGNKIREWAFFEGREEPWLKGEKVAPYLSL